MELSNLPAIVRVLMCTDGTVTRSLQAYFAEPVKVDVILQQEVELKEGDGILDCAKHQVVWLRRVRLVGGNSAKVYALAETWLNPARLPDTLKNDVAGGRLGVGELLQLQGLETRREILETGFANVLEGQFGEDCVGVNCPWRHYSISHSGAVLMHIREYFLLPSYSSGR